MVQLLVGPEWFYGLDTLFETFSIIVSFLVGVLAYKIYKLTSQKKYLNFCTAFLMIAAALSFKIISNFVVFYKTVEKTFYGLFTVTYTHSFDFINLASLYLFRVMFLIAFLIILINIYGIKDKKIISLIVFLSIVSIFFSNFTYLLFHLILALVIGFISFHYFKNYSSKKRRTALLVMLSFLAIFLSQLMFIFYVYQTGFYVLAETFQLLGFLFLLLAYVLISRK
ncbi:MAG: hypothetical protein AABW41_05610 [Nanoarchaeota archaeon]